MCAPHGLDCLRPEQISPDAPRTFEHLGQDEHGHVAAHTIALPGDSLQLADHRLLQVRVAVVELARVRPAVKVRVAAVGKHQRFVLPLHAAVVPRCVCQIILAAMDKVIRVLVDPRVVRGHVVHDKVEHQSQPALSQPLAQPGQTGIAPQIAMHSITADRKPGPGYIFFAQVRQGFLELFAPFRVTS